MSQMQSDDLHFLWKKTHHYKILRHYFMKGDERHCVNNYGKKT